jgi:hypothetical protein
MKYEALKCFEIKRCFGIFQNVVSKLLYIFKDTKTEGILLEPFYRNFACKGRISLPGYAPELHITPTLFKLIEMTVI